jgi:hypothetical protein
MSFKPPAFEGKWMVRCKTILHNKPIEHVKGFVLPMPEHHTVKAYSEHGSKAPFIITYKMEISGWFHFSKRIKRTSVM